MVLGISSIRSAGSLPPAVLAYYQRNVQNRTQPVQGAMYPQTGAKVGVQAIARDTFTPTSNQPTHTFAMWGQEFFFDPQFQREADAVDANGVKAPEATRRGVQEHEDAHYETAQRYGIRTGPPVVEMGSNGLPVGGHVELQTEKFDPKLALMKGKSYVDDFKYRMGEGLIESAIAPEKAGLSHEYGQLSGMDGDLGVKLLGEENLAKVANFESSDAGKALATLGQNPSPRAQQQLALMAQHPDLLQAFNNGTMG